MSLDTLCVKTEAEEVCVEEEAEVCEDEAGAHVKEEVDSEESAALCELYVGHQVKDELVLGPVEFHRPSVLSAVEGPASALLLLAALLAAGARADYVTTAECRARGRPGRVRQYPVDSDATWVDMHSCSLTDIPQHQLSGLPAVTVLVLQGNKLRELPVFDEHVCANLTYLYLHDNQLTGIYNAMTFSACTKLEVLDLDTNHIEFIEPSVFTALTSLKRLELYNNMIRYISDQLLASNTKLEVLYLHGNRITHLPPEFASRLKRAGAGLDAFYFNNNPWHCACLIELLADVGRAGVGYYYQRKYVGRAPVCVYTRAAPCCRRAPTGLLRYRK